MDMTKILNITSISKVVFKMRSLPANLEVKISLLNRDRNCQRPLSENSMLFTGDEIRQESNSDKDRVYFLELRYTRDNLKYHTVPQAGPGLFFCIKRSDHAKNFV